MNTYTFSYYGFIPGYNDFDIDWFDVKASSVAEAQEIVKTYDWIMAKCGPELVAINGHSLNDHLAQITELN